MAKNGIEVTQKSVVGSLGTDAAKYFEKSTNGVSDHITLTPGEKDSDTITITLKTNFGVMASTEPGANLFQFYKDISNAVLTGAGPQWAIEFITGVMQHKLDLQDPRNDDRLNFRLGPFPVKRVPEVDDPEDYDEGDAIGLEVGARITGALMASSTTFNSTDAFIGVWLTANTYYQERREITLQGDGKIKDKQPHLFEDESLEHYRRERELPENVEHHFYIDTGPTEAAAGGNTNLANGSDAIKKERWYNFEVYTETEAPFEGDYVLVDLNVNLRSHAEHTALAFGTNVCSVIINEVTFILTPLHSLYGGYGYGRSGGGKGGRGYGGYGGDGEPGIGEGNLKRPGG